MLRPFLGDARRVMALMPAQQGVMPWPPGASNVSLLVEETRWPVATGAVDRLIVAHGLETCERPNDLIAEVARVLAPRGQAVFIVPNRSGLWARRDGTPFGFGRPYSFGQIEAILARHHLRPARHSAALYAPPSHRRFWLQTAQMWERIGRRFDPHLVAGALLIEAARDIYARPGNGTEQSVLGRLEGLAKPVPAPAAGMDAAARDAGPKACSGRLPGVLPPCNPSAITAPVFTEA
jgi:SAM-dependent methyltransferase